MVAMGDTCDEALMTDCKVRHAKGCVSCAATKQRNEETCGFVVHKLGLRSAQGKLFPMAMSMEQSLSRDLWHQHWRDLLSCSQQCSRYSLQVGTEKWLDRRSLQWHLWLEGLKEQTGLVWGIWRQLRLIICAPRPAIQGKGEYICRG